MKKILSIVTTFAICILSAGIAAVCFSCASTEPLVMANYSPVAILSVTSNTTVPWYDADKKANTDEEDEVNEDSVINSMLNNTLNSKNPEISSKTDRINEAEKILRDSLAESGMKLLDKNIVLNSSSYKYVNGNMLDFLTAYCIPDGYKKLSSDSSKVTRMILNEVGAKAGLFVVFQFEKERVSGSVSSGVRARTTMTVRFVNENGKVILRKDFVGVSTTTVPFVNRKYDKDALVDIIPESIKAAITRFVYSFDLTGVDSSDNVLVENPVSEEGTAIPLPVKKTNEEENLPIANESVKEDTATVKNEDDIQTRLEKLNNLYKQGLISEEDYNKRKNEILSEI
ncbi:MAG: SHOCT domain-containing protein [Treponema sp.]|nr:SHOCT domain-containing protein [Treponema sp.]